MKNLIDIVLAWFVGGFIGRLVGASILVKALNLPPIYGWLSVPIGAGAAWIWVDIKQIIPALRHSYRWAKRGLVQRPMIGVDILADHNGVIRYFKNIIREFHTNCGWRIFGALNRGLLMGTWVCLIYMTFIYGWQECRGTEISMWSSLVAVTRGLAMCSMLGGIMLILLVIVCSFFGKLGWDKKIYNRQTILLNDEKKEALEYFWTFLLFNPLSLLGISITIITYGILRMVAKIGTWVVLIIWRVIQIINKSQRTTVLAGATIGLTISQIFGYNPIICALTCVAVGLVQKAVFHSLDKISQERGLNHLKT
jgi:hypothetical protein